MRGNARQAGLRGAGERCGLSVLRDAGRSGAGRGARVWRKWAERVEPAGPDWAEGFAGFCFGFGLGFFFYYFFYFFSYSN